MKKILSLFVTCLSLSCFSSLTYSEQSMQENQPINKVEKKVLPTKMLQEIYDTGDPGKLKSFFIDVTSIALKYIPLGITQQEAIELLKENGFTHISRVHDLIYFEHSLFSERDYCAQYYVRSGQLIELRPNEIRLFLYFSEENKLIKLNARYIANVF